MEAEAQIASDPATSPRLIVPPRYSMLDRRFYRSSYPAPRSIPFLENLRLRSMICLSPKDMRSELREYISVSSISLLEVDIGTNMEPFEIMSNSAVEEAINFGMRAEHHPCLIFCNNGKTKTGCFVACLRIHTGWSVVSALQEFKQQIEPDGGTGLGDYSFIEAFSMPE